MKFKVITLFPEMISSYASAAMLGRAAAAGLIEVTTINPRVFTTDRHQTVDDKPYGGGAGMVMKPEPLYKAIKAAAPRVSKKRCIVLLSASGRQFTERVAKEFAQNYSEIVFVCGRYEGIDARVAEFVDEEVSVGPFVLTGGELPTLIIIDAVARLVPGVLGNESSLDEESHNEEGSGEYPQYTRPESFKGHVVPPELLSGNHGAIAAWRKKNTKKF